MSSGVDVIDLDNKNGEDNVGNGNRIPLSTGGDDIDDLEVDDSNDQEFEVDISSTEVKLVEEKDVDISGSLLGVFAKTSEELYNIYKKHSQMLGFSIRRNGLRRADLPGRPELERYFVCSCAGPHANGKKRTSSAPTRLVPIQTILFGNASKAIEVGDAETLLKLLNDRTLEDPGFFYRVKFRGDGRLCNVFWRDSMMKVDYLLYHDVVIFDTTYKTNKYNLICGAFVGVNNHWSNVMFGFAFVSNENQESFEWLFNAFNESMEPNVVPVTIFTDQDLAMNNTIEEYCR